VAREDFSELMLSEPKLAKMILRAPASEVRSARLAISGRSKESCDLEQKAGAR
jgi:hypothetical protein